MTKLSLLCVLICCALLPASALAAEDPPAESVLGFAPSPVEFAKTTTGSESQTLTVDVENVGPGGSEISKVSIEGTDASDFKLSGSNCGWLEIGAHCSVWVAFAPGSDGAKNATLVLERKEQPSQSVPVTGTAVPVALAFTPGSYDFGIQRTNQGGSAYVQLGNQGEGAVQLGSVGMGGRDTGNFWVGNNDCWNGRWLQPGESCSIQVYFNPWDMAAYEAQLQASAYGTTATADVTGTGGRTVLEAEANPFDLGSAAVGSSGPVRTITLTNNGNYPGGFFIAVVAGGDVASFQLLDESCTGAPVSPGAICVAHVRFTPQSTGPKTARLALFGETEGGTMVALTGVGTPAEPASAADEGHGTAARAKSDSKPRKRQSRRVRRGKSMGGAALREGRVAARIVARGGH